jgi:hypothetical protein
MSILAAPGRLLRRFWPWTGIVGALLLGGLISGLSVTATESSSSAIGANTCPATTVANDALPSVVTIAARAHRVEERAQERSFAVTATF